MKSNYFLPAIAIALGIAVAGYMISRTIVSGKKLDRQVSVKGLAEREVPADLAVWPLQISLAGNNLIDLQSQLKANGDELMQFFIKQQFTGEEISRGVTNIVDAYADRYRTDRPPNRYIATADYTLRTDDIKKLEAALDAAPNLVSKGIIITSKNTWMPIEYIFTGLNDIKPAMVEEATNNARIVAEQFAKDSGSKVGRIKRAVQGLFSINNRDANTPQIKKVRVVNTVEYYLED